MLDSVKSVKVSHANAEAKKAQETTDSTQKEYGWMKEKNGNAFGFKEHNKHYLSFQEQLKALEAAKQAAAQATQEATTVAETENAAAVASGLDLAA